MRQDRYTTLTGIAFLVGIIATVYGYTTISGEMATHFTATGQPDGTMAKIPGLLLAPGMMAVVYGFFRVLPRIDPLEENYERFREAYRGMIVAVLGFLAYLQVVLVGWNVGLAFNMTQAITPAVAGLLFIAGMVIERAEQNWFIGIRTPWTLSSEEVWERTHETFGPLFKVGAALVLVTIVLPSYATAIIGGTAAVLAAGSFIYSYAVYRQNE
jgi:uncharacterized membrane protein